MTLRAWPKAGVARRSFALRAQCRAIVSEASLSRALFVSPTAMLMRLNESCFERVMDREAGERRCRAQVVSSKRQARAARSLAVIFKVNGKHGIAPRHYVSLLQHWRRDPGRQH